MPSGEKAGCLGSVDLFAEACLEPREGARLTSTALFQAYRAWCMARHEVPYRDAEFTAMMRELANDIGIAVEYRGGNCSFLDVAHVPSDGNDTPKNAG